MSLVTPIVQRWIDEGRRDPDAFWARAAREVPWFRTWDRVFEWDPPTFRWFAGAQTNLGYNAVDRHVADGHGGRAALVYVNERGDRVVQTYAQLLHAVKRVSAALRALGIRKGDRITIYMPPCPESIALMLAAVRIGAIHSIVFAGFGAQARAARAPFSPPMSPTGKARTSRCCRSSRRRSATKGYRWSASSCSRATGPVRPRRRMRSRGTSFSAAATAATRATL